MKTIQSLSLFFFLLFFLAACQEDEHTSCTVSIQLTAPSDYPELSFDGMTVVLTNQSGQGTEYKATCSPTGLAVFHAEYGEYAASVHYQTPAGMIFNGRTASILLSPEKGDIVEAIKLPLSRAQTNALVIKEIYYGGCKDKNGKDYVIDQYITLYNNSEETLYLDGLCIAVIDFQSRRKPSPWMEYTDMARIPVLDYTWQFPGKGTEHPLAPATEVTIATNAVDHTGGTYGHANSVNLSAVDFGFYNVEEFEAQVITPGIPWMNLLSRTNPFGNRYQFAIPNLPIMVFSIQGVDPDTYVNNPANREPCPKAADQDTKYLMIPREWVIDCVECSENATTAALHRVPAELDAKAIYMPGGTYQGSSIIRRSKTSENGRVVYQDTNNSSEDMIVSPTPALKK